MSPLFYPYVVGFVVMGLLMGVVIIGVAIGVVITGVVLLSLLIM